MLTQPNLSAIHALAKPVARANTRSKPNSSACTAKDAPRNDGERFSPGVRIAHRGLRPIPSPRTVVTLHYAKILNPL